MTATLIRQEKITRTDGAAGVARGVDIQDAALKLVFRHREEGDVAKLCRTGRFVQLFGNALTLIARGIRHEQLEVMVADAGLECRTRRDRVGLETAAPETGPAALLDHRQPDVQDCHLTLLRRLVEAVADRGPLAHGWSVDTATDALWLSVTARAAHTALHTLGWSPDLLVHCVTAQLRALLLPSDDRTVA